MKIGNINTLNGLFRMLGKILFFLLSFFIPIYTYAEENTGISTTFTLYPDILLPVLLLLVAALLAIIIGLSVYLHRQKRRLRSCQEHLVRYITNNLEMKKHVPGSKEPYAFYPPDVTPEEFTKIIDNMLKRIMFLSLFVLCMLPLAAQDTAHAATVTTTETPSAVPTKLKNEFLLHADLLRWATLTPDLGVEWRIDCRWSVQLNGTWTSWSWDNKSRRYALWEVSPEVRYYIGKKQRGYLGAMYHVGEFNYKLRDTGKQGHLSGGGMTGGYLLRLNRSLAMDFSLGLGCTRAEYDKYTVTDGVRVKHGRENKNYWGVNHAGITLVWQLK